MSDIRNFFDDYLLDCLFRNRGMVNLISIGLFSLIFEPYRMTSDLIIDYYKLFYSLLIGVGLSGLLCWVFAFKIFNEKFNIYYKLWLFCYAIQIFFYLFILGTVLTSQNIKFSIIGLLLGLIIPLLMLETMLNFKYKFSFRKSEVET